jgi:transposase
LHVDGYAGFEPLTSNGDVVLAACWSHARRKFYEVAQATNAPIATEALRQIAKLYAIEADVRGQSPGHRLAARRNRSKRVVETMRLRCRSVIPATNIFLTMPQRRARSKSGTPKLSMTRASPVPL